jgi:two-component system, LuxR family, response regulator FixJ
MNSTKPQHERVAVTIGDTELARRCARGRVVVIDDDEDVLQAVTGLIQSEGYACEPYASANAYLAALQLARPAFPGPVCVLSDVYMDGIDGLALQRQLADFGDLPLVLMSGNSGIREAVSAFRAGAVDFLIKPFEPDALLAALKKALSLNTESGQSKIRKESLAERAALLTQRERDVARRVAAGQTNPAIAQILSISLRTVKRHRQRAMEKLGAHVAADLVRIADEAGL